PVSLFSDARLVSMAAAIQSASRVLLLLVAVALVSPTPPLTREASTLAGVVAALVLAAVLAWFPFLSNQLKSTVRTPRRKRGEAWATVLLLACALIMVSGTMLRAVILGAVRPGKEVNWPVVCLTLLFALVLAQLCTYLGRRQMELLADENAVNALADFGDD